MSLAIANRPQPPAVDPRTLTELAARLAAAEQAMGRLADLDARIAKAEAAAAAACNSSSSQQQQQQRRAALSPIRRSPRA